MTKCHHSGLAKLRSGQIYGDVRFYEWDEKCVYMIDKEVMMIRWQMINDIDDDNAGDDNDQFFYLL